MTISIIDRKRLLGDLARDEAERRLLFALARYDSRIRKVTMELTEESPPGGVVERVCRLSVRLRAADAVEVCVRDRDLQRCVARVVERCRRSVARSLARDHQVDRRGSGMGDLV